METENIDANDMWEERIFFVAAPRKGRAPSIEKAIEDGIDGPIFFTWDKAHEVKERVNGRHSAEESYDDGGLFEVFEAVINVPVKGPCLRDPDMPR